MAALLSLLILAAEPAAAAPPSPPVVPTAAPAPARERRPVIIADEPLPEAILAKDLPADFLRGEAEDIAVVPDRLARMTVPVRIEGRGPFDFIIDTASQRTILSTQISRDLTLDVEDEVTIIALAGSTVVKTVFVPELTLGRRNYDGLISPTFDTSNIGADGILGLDSLQGQRILFDFAEDRISVEDTTTKLRSRSPNEIVVTARRRSGQLIFTNATISGVRVSVVIDTGGEVSIGNRALQRRLGLKNARLEETSLVDVTGKSTTANYGLVKDLRIGRAGFDHVPIAFADIAPFAALDLDRRPAMFLGMDALRNFERVGIDFKNRKIYFLVPDA